MEPTNSSNESQRRRIPPSVLVILVASLAGAGISRIQRAFETPPSVESGNAETVSSSEVSHAGATPGHPSSSVGQLPGFNEGRPDETPEQKPSTELDSNDGKLIEPVEVSVDDGTAVADEPESTTVPDAVLKKAMLGTWEDDYKGHRTLTLYSDGTGRMVVELDGIAATLFAKTLTFDEEWNVADGKVTMKATGGEPVGKVKLVLNLHGDSSTQRIIEVTDERMVLIEEPSGTRFEWRRVRASESSED